MGGGKKNHRVILNDKNPTYLSSSKIRESSLIRPCLLFVNFVDFGEFRVADRGGY